MQKDIVAYKTWKCRFCSEVRDEAVDMWRHLQEEHEIVFVENDSKVMLGLNKENT